MVCPKIHWIWPITTWRSEFSPFLLTVEADGRSPVIDGHIDLPILVREFYGNNLSSFNLEQETVRSEPINRSETSEVVESWIVGERSG